MLRRTLLIALIGSLLSPIAAAQSDEACTIYMLYKESRGEPIKTSRAVLDVFENRQAKQGMTACEVLHQQGQYPYAKHGVKRLDFSATVRYNVVRGMEHMLDSDYLYFNIVRHPWGKATVKVGKLYFSK